MDSASPERPAEISTRRFGNDELSTSCRELIDRDRPEGCRSRLTILALEHLQNALRHIDISSRENRLSAVDRATFWGRGGDARCRGGCGGEGSLGSERSRDETRCSRELCSEGTSHTVLSSVNLFKETHLGRCEHGDMVSCKLTLTAGAKTDRTKLIFSGIFPLLLFPTSWCGVPEMIVWVLDFSGMAMKCSDCIAMTIGWSGTAR